MLVVLAIIGIAAGAVALGLGNATRGTSAETEARRLAARIRLVADDTMVTDRPAAFVADADGYGFLAWDALHGRWQPGETGLFVRHVLPAGIHLTTAAKDPVRIGMDGSGTTIDARVASARDRWQVHYDGFNVVAARAGAP